MSDFRDHLFTWRSYTPLPFLVIGLIIGSPTPVTIFGGLGIALTGELIRLWGVGHATSETRATGCVGASRLIISGPFAFVRNPLYIGNILIYTGFAAMANNGWLMLATLLWFLFQYAMIVSREEEYLAEKFGEEYERYRESVGRFIPRFAPYEPGEERERCTMNWTIAFRSDRRTFQALVIATVLLTSKYFWIQYL